MKVLAAASLSRHALIDRHEILPHAMNVAKLVFGAASRLLGRRPETYEIFNARLEMEPQLIVDISRDGRPNQS